MIIFEYVAYFFAWTFILYWVHRFAHKVKSPVMKTHWEHHKVVLTQEIKWMWPMIFLWQEGWKATLDIIYTEAIPTIIFCAITGQWWILVWWYIWTAFIQEHIEHNPNFNIYPFSAGKTHLVHHRNSNYNYSLFFPIWDIVFGTYKSYKELENK